MTRPAPPPAPLALGHVPRHAIVFSGHMADAPGRKVPRFPAALWPAARSAIDAALDQLAAGPRDVALTQGAAGGDLLFAEACAARGVPLQFLLPLPEPRFIEQSVLGCDGAEDWRARFFDLKARLRDAPRVMPIESRAPPGQANVFERCNLWMLRSALAHGVARLRFICLWDGAADDGPGGTAHLYRAAAQRTDRITWIDTRGLAAGAAAGAP